MRLWCLTFSSHCVEAFSELLFLPRKQPVFEGVASSGLVKVEINGAFEMISVKIDPSVVDPEDVEMLEDLVIVAYNDAKEKAEEMKNSKLGAFGGLI